MMGTLEDDHDALVDKTTGGVIVLPDEHVVIRRRRQDWQQIVTIGRSACDQCSFCTELCPRWLLGHPIEPHRAMRSLEFNLVGEANVVGTSFCCECNLCSLYSCPEDLDPKNVCTQNKRRIWRRRSGDGRTRPSIPAGRRCTWPTARRRWAGCSRSSGCGSFATSARCATSCCRRPRWESS